MTPYPSQVMYDTLKSFSHISNKDAAMILIRSDFQLGGRTLHERIMSDRTYISRYVANVAPGYLPPSCFEDFAQSALALAGRTLKNLGLKDSYNQAIEYYSGPAAESMAEALAAVNESPHLYNNMVINILKRSDLSQSDMLTLLVMLFIVAGSIGSSSIAVQVVESFSANMLARGFHTEAATMHPVMEDSGSPQETTINRLGLMRKSGDFAKMHVYELSDIPTGTVIGRNPSSAPSIDDVDDIVSSDHLRIWLGNDGRWLAEGIGSTNGTVLISGEDKSMTVIEPPRKARADWISSPVEILPGDVLVLAGVTEFLVIAP